MSKLTTFRKLMPFSRKKL